MFLRQSYVPIVDKPQTKSSKTLITDLAVNTESENILTEMDVVRQAVRNWVLTNYGERLDDYTWGSNLVRLIGMSETEALEELSSLDLFWDRMEAQVEYVTVTREKSFVTLKDGKVYFSCYIIDDITKHVLDVQEVIG